MTNSEQAIREFAEKWGIKQNDEPTFDPHTENLYYGYTHCVKQCLSDLTAIISEHYVSREEYDEEKKSNSLLHKAMVTAEKGGHDKAMEEISEHYYPKEFLLWTGENCQYYPDTNEWMYFESPMTQQYFKGTDELFNYWKENEQ